MELLAPSHKRGELIIVGSECSYKLNFKHLSNWRSLIASLVKSPWFYFLLASDFVAAARRTAEGNQGGELDSASGSRKLLWALLGNPHPACSAGVRQTPVLRLKSVSFHHRDSDGGGRRDREPISYRSCTESHVFLQVCCKLQNRINWAAEHFLKCKNIFLFWFLSLKNVKRLPLNF